MNKLTRSLTFAAISATLAMPTFARATAPSLQQQQPQQQQPATGTTTAAQPAQDDAAAKTALYTQFREKLTAKDQAAAYELGKQYVTKYPGDTDQIATYVKNFVTNYEKALPKFNCDKLVADKKWSEAFAACKQVAANEPEDLKTHINLAWAGLFGAIGGDQQLMTEAAPYTQKAIQLINAGKTPEQGQAFANKDETLGWMHYALGYYNLKSNPKEATNYLHKAATYEGSTKKDPQTYAWLAIAYQTGDYTRLSQEYKTMHEGKPETPESKAALENIGQVLDRIIDSYARAIAYANASTDAARYANAKQTWMTDLTPLYKFRHNDSEAGLPELINTVITKPLPSPTITPVTPATMTDPAATPTGTTPAPQGTTPTGTTPTGTTPTGTTPSGTTTTGTTPSGTTTTPAPSGTTAPKPSGTTTTAPSGTTTTPSTTKPTATPTPKPTATPTPKPTASTPNSATTTRPR